MPEEGRGIVNEKKWISTPENNIITPFPRKEIWTRTFLIYRLQLAKHPMRDQKLDKVFNNFFMLNGTMTIALLLHTF